MPTTARTMEDRRPFRSLFAWFVLFVAGCTSDAEPSTVAPAPPPTSAGDEAPEGEAPEASEQEATDDAVAAGPTVLFLGDSLSAGLHVDAEDAYPAQLHRLLEGRGTPFRLVNAGVSGDTTAGGLRRLDWLLQQEPDWVVVELGGNDGLRGVPLEAIEANLRAIVEKARASGARVLLLGMKLPPNYGPDYTSGFEALFERVAAEERVAFVPFFLEGVGGNPELNFPDGIHPTEEGHRRMAENLAPVFEELLGQPRE